MAARYSDEKRGMNKNERKNVRRKKGHNKRKIGVELPILI